MTWKDLDDIGEQKLKIGTVLGYANTDEFDAKVGTGWIHAIPSNDNDTNLKKLVRKRSRGHRQAGAVVSLGDGREPQGGRRQTPLRREAARGQDPLSVLP